MPLQKCDRCDNEIPNCQSIFSAYDLKLCPRCAEAWKRQWEKKQKELFLDFVESG